MLISRSRYLATSTAGMSVTHISFTSCIGTGIDLLGNIKQGVEVLVTIMTPFSRSMVLPAIARGTGACRGRAQLQSVLHRRRNRLDLHEHTQLIIQVCPHLVAAGTRLAGIRAGTSSLAQGTHRATMRGTA